MKKDSLEYFAIKFCVIAAVLLVIFHFTFPFYKNLVGDVLKLFSSTVKIEYRKASLVFMPFVSLFALILSTPKQTIKYRIKSLLIVFAVFFFIDVSFSILQIVLYGFVDVGWILVVQDFFVIASPVVLWLILFNKSFQFL